MRNRIIILLLFFVQVSLSYANNGIIQKGNVFRIIDDVDLAGNNWELPQGSIIQFENGTIRNGTLTGRGTFLKGKISLDCDLSGSFLNSMFYSSWFVGASPSHISKTIASVLNLIQEATVYFDRDVSMDGSQYTVNRVSFESNGHIITNPCCYCVKGDVMIKGLGFIAKSKNELFLDFSHCQERNPKVLVDSIRFDAAYFIDRFLYLPTNPSCDKSTMTILNSDFSHFNRFVIHVPSKCSGSITSCKFVDIGDGKNNHISAIWLGIETGDNSFGACDFQICDNAFERIRAFCSTEAESREAHAILIYGHRNSIRNNTVARIYSTESSDGDPGFDSEGIYLKGGNNKVVGNHLVDAVGSGPDGSITVKSQYSGNQIKNNTISHRFGTGIQCYTDKSIIAHNEIISREKALISISTVLSNGTKIQNNTLVGEDLDYLTFKASIYVGKSENITVSFNTVRSIPTMLVTYSNVKELVLTNNLFTIEAVRYGQHSYYSAPFSLHEEDCTVVFKKNRFYFSDVRASQIIESWTKSFASIIFSNNTVSLKTTGQKDRDTACFISFCFRNCEFSGKKNYVYSDKESSLQAITNGNNTNENGFKMIVE